MPPRSRYRRDRRKKARVFGLFDRVLRLLEQTADGVDRIRRLVHILLALRMGIHLRLGVVVGIAAAFAGLRQRRRE